MNPSSAVVPVEKPIIDMMGVTVGSLLDLDRLMLENVNWKVMAGEYWVVAGMHGSGKTDLLSTAGGLVPPRRGVYRLFGCEMPIYDNERLPERLRLGLVFEDGQLIHQLSVRDNIALPLRYHRHLSWKDVEDRVNTIMEMTELSSVASARPGMLTRDWLKRAGLARALMLQPEILLLDHPLGGLDLRQTSWWMHMLEQLFAGRSLLGGPPMTLVVTAQDLRPWQHFNCHFAILKKKEFVTLGHRPELNNHKEPLVKELLAQTLPQT